MARLMEYEYPGNVRELENIIEQAFVLCRDRIIELHHLPAELRPVAPASYAGPGPMSLESMEKLLIREALRRHKGNRTKAARQLGINPSTLYRKMKVLDIGADDESS
jgi:DNA-binding NtrC family response regulator